MIGVSRLLEQCARQVRWTLAPEHAVNPRGKRRVVVDGVPVDGFGLMHGHWEAKVEDLSERPRQPIFYGLY